MSARRRASDRRSSKRPSQGLLACFATALAFLALAPAARASHAIEKTIGSAAPGTSGGLFNSPTDLAVRHSSGQLYVADTANNRIQRFDSEGDFELAFGRDVIKPGAPGDLGDAFEVCTVAADCQAGSTGTAADGPGGELNRPVGIGIKQSTGQLYVREASGVRISVFDPDGAWQRSFGWGVAKAGGVGDQPNANERQVITLSALTINGKEEFDLNFAGAATAPLPYNSSAASVQSALEAISTLNPGDISVSGPLSGPWTVDFLGTGALAGLDASEIAINGVGFSDVGAVATEIQGGAYEICTVAADCLAATSGDAAGQLGTSSAETVAGVAVDQASGEIYVADPGSSGNSNSRINHYSATGAFIRAFGWGVDTGTGQFEICTAATSCQTANELHQVLQPANGQFRRFGSPTDIAIDSAGVLYAEQGTGSSSDTHVFRFDTTKTIAAQLLLPLTITTVSPNLDWIDNGWPIGNLDSKQPIGLEVDPVSANLLLLGGSTSNPVSVQEIDPSVAPATVVERHAEEGGVPGLMGAISGLGYDPTDDTLYASTRFTGHRILVFSTTPADPVSATSAPATEIDKRSATLNGTVDPNGPAGVDTRYRFEYKKQADPDWIALSANDENLGDGTSPVAVSQDFDETQLVSFSGAPSGGTFTLDFSGDTTTPIAFDASAAAVDAALEALATVTAGNVSVTGPAGGPWKVGFEGALGLKDQPQLQGSGSGLVPSQSVNVTTLVNGRALEANTEYQFRIRAYKPFGQGGEAISNETTFITATSPPEVQTLYPQSRADDSARLTGLINPNNSPTDYRFEYGETLAYGTSAPVPDATISGGTEKLVIAEVEGLKPSTTYHYRLVADNGTEEAPGDTTVEAADVAFTTREAVAPDPKRSFEMVSPPLKVTRSTVARFTRAGYNANPGLPSLDGEAIRWDLFYFPLLDTSGFPFNGERLITRRTPDGWVTEPLQTQPLLPQYIAFGRDIGVLAQSGDLETGAWLLESSEEKPGALLPNEGEGPLASYTRKDGTGTNGFSGWLDNVDTQQVGVQDLALFNDDGTAMARWGEYRGLAEDPEAPGGDDPSDEQQLPSNEGGKTPYLQLNPPLGEKDLISECNGAATNETQTITMGATGGTFKLILSAKTSANTTFNASAGTVENRLANAPISLGVGNVEVTKAGSVWTIAFVGDLTGTDVPQIALDTTGLTGGTATAATVQDGAPDPDGTLIPTRSDNGTSFDLSDDKLATRGCFEGQMVSRRGAIVGAKLNQVAGAGSGIVSGAADTALADTGKRVYFTAPDPSAEGAFQLSACQSATGAASLCPPQLFVRSYASQGDPRVRWVSKPAPAMPTQAISLLGPAGFEAASRDGSVVYFKTNTPLTPDDPNGTGTPGPKSTGNASSSSWDLYRYELPESLDDDPADGTLTRISGGPTGTADPNTNPSGRGGAARFVSDDGRRAYFVTGAPIAGADASPPKGGATEPGGGGRNLYLFDDTGPSPEWRFVARIPFAASSAAGPVAYNACASSESQAGFPTDQVQHQTKATVGKSCVRGTTTGSAIAFMTQGRLTEDDRDDSADVYLYDALGDELVRASAPPPGSEGYPCVEAGSSGAAKPWLVEVRCNATLGFNGGWLSQANYDAQRGWGGGRYLNIAEEPGGSISVVFQSLSQLTPDDQNDNHWDVYRWREGELEMVSRGLPDQHSHYSGNSTDGEDVFIWTSDRIDPREIDEADYDIYDWRIGEGFPYSPPPTPCEVLTLGCEAEAKVPPPTNRPSSGAQTQGNVAQPSKRCAKGKVRRKGRCVNKRKARKNKRRAANTEKKGGRR